MERKRSRQELHQSRDAADAVGSLGGLRGDLQQSRDCPALGVGPSHEHLDLGTRVVQAAVYSVQRVELS